MYPLKVAKKHYSDQRDSIVQDQTVNCDERGYEEEKYPMAHALYYLLFYFSIFQFCWGLIDMSILDVIMLFNKMHLFMYISIISLIACLPPHMAVFVYFW